MKHAGEWIGQPVDGTARTARIRALMIEETESQERTTKKTPLHGWTGVLVVETGSFRLCLAEFSSWAFSET